MDKLTIALDYQRPPSNNGDTPISDAALTADYITYAVNNSHPQGLEGQMRRIFGRIQRKLDAAIDGGAEDIELEQAEKDFLRTSFRDCKVPAQIAKHFIVLEDELDRVTAKSS